MMGGDGVLMRSQEIPSASLPGEASLDDVNTVWEFAGDADLAGRGA